MSKEKVRSQEEIEKTVEVIFDDEGIVRINFLEAIYEDDQNTVQAQAGVDKVIQLLSEKEITEPVRVLVNLVPMHSSGYISKDAREVYVDFVQNKLIKKVAVIGSSDSQISIANFVLTFNVNLRAKLSWFSTEIEAKYWVKQ